MFPRNMEYNADVVPLILLGVLGFLFILIIPLWVLLLIRVRMYDRRAFDAIGRPALLSINPFNGFKLAGLVVGSDKLTTNPVNRRLRATIRWLLLANVAVLTLFVCVLALFP